MSVQPTTIHLCVTGSRMSRESESRSPFYWKSEEIKKGELRLHVEKEVI